MPFFVSWEQDKKNVSSVYFFKLTNFYEVDTVYIMNPSLNLSGEQIEAFGEELESLYNETKAKVGQEDLAHIKSMIALSQALEISGRALIHTAKDPVSWLLGVLLLGHHYLIEFSELGHNILHGQFDGIEGNEEITSGRFKWDCTMDEGDWKHEHHAVHHPFTNILGKDNDFGFLVYRIHESQEWKPYHLLQVPMILTMPLVNTFFFPWFVATGRALSEKKEINLDTYIPSIKKLSEHFFKNYLFYPMLPGASYAKVALGNFSAKFFQNLFLEMILAISHLHKDAYVFQNNPEETKGEYYLRQVLSTINFEAPPSYEVMFGAINLHVEHHLFPDLPPNRLREIAPRVRSICEKFGVPYRTGPFLTQFFGVIENALFQSFPLNESKNRVGDFKTEFKVNDRVKENHKKAESKEDEKSFFIKLIRSNQLIPVREKTTILEALENAKVPITAGCRKGRCKSCHTLKVSGRIDLETEDSDPRKRIPTCVSYPKTDIELDL